MRKESKKMDCKTYRDVIDGYVTGRLEAGENLSFEDHLKSCPECTELVRLQKLADRIIDEEKKSEPGYYLTGRIMNRIEDSEGESRSALVRIMRPALISISVAAAIFAGVIIGNIPVKPEVKAVPVEMTLMNDIAMESVNVLAGE